MERFFKDLERLTYAILVTKVGINDRLERFSELTSSIEKKEDLWTSESPLQLTPAEQHETFATLSGPIYQTLSARARSTVLVRLDALISGGGASYDYDTITVEHVLPQNPEAGSEWLNWFPDAGPRANLVHMLGNLALLTRKKNSAASNYSFEKKKTEYFSHGGVSPFPLTTQVLQHKSWSPAVIESRQNELLTKLEQQWRLEQRLEEFEENAVESSGASSGFQFTRRVELEAKRTAVVEGFFNSRGAVASRKSKTNYEDSGKSLRVTCVISKRFSRDDVAYWYALHPNWIEFMKGAHHGYYVLGCMDLKVAYALSFAFVKEHLQEFNKTDKDNRHYWHVALKVANGKVLLNLSKVSKQIDLSPYKFELINSA